MTRKQNRNKRKEKNRQERVKARLLVRRKELRIEAKELRDTEKSEKHFAEKLFPIRNDVKESIDLEKENNKSIYEPKMTEQISMKDPRRKEWVLKKLEHNKKILDALEKEILIEDAQREAVQESLKSKGATTLHDQMDLIGQQAEDIIDKQDQAFQVTKKGEVTKKGRVSKKGSGKITGHSTVQLVNTSDDEVELVVESEEITAKPRILLDPETGEPIEWTYKADVDLPAVHNLNVEQQL